MEKIIHEGKETVEVVRNRTIHLCDNCEKESRNMMKLVAEINLGNEDMDIDFKSYDFCSFKCLGVWWDGDSDSRKSLDRQKKHYYLSDLFLQKLHMEDLGKFKNIE